MVIWEKVGLTRLGAQCRSSQNEAEQAVQAGKGKTRNGNKRQMPFKSGEMGRNGEKSSPRAR